MKLVCIAFFLLTSINVYVKKELVKLINNEHLMMKRFSQLVKVKRCTIMSIRTKFLSIQVEDRLKRLLLEEESPYYK